MLMFIISLLQNCTKIEDIISILEMAYKIYLSPRSTPEVNKSLLRVKILLATKRGVLDVYLELKKEKKRKSSDDAQNSLTQEDAWQTFYYGESNDTKTSVVNASPFRFYFDDLFATLETEDIDSSTEMLPENAFYSKPLLDLIKKYLYILPLWSGLIL